MPEPVGTTGPRLERQLGVWDGALITIGSVIGTGIFLTTSNIALVLPHAAGVLAVWLVGGLLTLAGALTYAELGAMFPEAGGIYLFLREAYGPLTGFLYGWACFFVIMTGGIAAIAVGFGEYFGSFFPFFSTQHVLWSLPLGSFSWTVNGGQLAGSLAILLLTAINHRGVRQGAIVQNLMTVIKIGAIGLFVVGGFLVPAKAHPQWTAPLPPLSTGWLAAFGVAMIAALWTYDGWYGLTFSAGEMKDPARTFPRGIIFGTAAIVTLYVTLNLAYLRALPVGEMGGTARIGEAAAQQLFGAGASRWLSAAIVISTFGCLAGTILYAARIYLPMSQERLFFRSVGKIHPRFHTPAISLWVQAGIAIVETLSGRYDQLYTYVVFMAVAFHALTGAAVFVLRWREPDRVRPYRVWGYPAVPALFILASFILMANTLKERPVESLIGVGLIALGVPAYAFWRRGAGSR
ncbi:MAG: amino acid permease [Thermoanaerobaculia bacterium]